MIWLWDQKEKLFLQSFLQFFARFWSKLNGFWVLIIYHILQIDCFRNRKELFAKKFGFFWCFCFLGAVVFDKRNVNLICIFLYFSFIWLVQSLFIKPIVFFICFLCCSEAFRMINLYRCLAFRRKSRFWKAVFFQQWHRRIDCFLNDYSQLFSRIIQFMLRDYFLK